MLVEGCGRPALDATADSALGDRAARRRLSQAWRRLELAVPCSVFQSWAWVGTWMQCLPIDTERIVTKVESDGRIVGLGVFAQPRHTPDMLVLHQAGEADMDSVFVEHNGLLVEPSLAESVYRSVFGVLFEARGVRRIRVDGTHHTDAIVRAANRLGLKVGERARKVAPFAELISHGSTSAYLARLSRNSRHQIGRSLRLYSARGAVRFSEAQNIREAHAMFGRLSSMHQASWTARGHPGMFSYPFFSEFHSRLVGRAFNAGLLQLGMVEAGNCDVGYLYNLRHRGVVYAYQSAFRFEPDNRLKPGLVSHLLAMSEAGSRCYQRYDFLAGDSQYKRVFARASTRLDWLVLTT